LKFNLYVFLTVFDTKPYQLRFNEIIKLFNTLIGRKDRNNGGMLGKCKGLTMTDQTTSTEEEGLRVDRRAKVFYVENIDMWALFDTEFITLKTE